MTNYQPSPGPYYQPMQPPPPRRKHTGLKVFAVLSAVVLAGAGACTAVVYQGASDALKEIPTTVPTVDGSAGQTKTPAATPQAKPKGKETVPSFLPRNGTLLVGPDVKPGTYQATCPADAIMCYWARLKNTSGDIGSIIANEIVDAGAKATLTIKATDNAVEITGFGGATWKRIR